MSALGRLWIGPSGWSYPDWNGIVYPLPQPRGFKPLRFLSRLFDAVEVNTSFYRVPTARMTAAWPQQTPPDFRFAFKLTKMFTHDRGAEIDAAAVREFKEALRPIRDAGKLGPLLIQFPWSFRFREENAAHVRRLADAFRECDAVFEVRHASWAGDEALQVLRACGGVCNVDQPALRDCLPPAAHVFGPTGYVRLHGRNARTWFAEGLPPFERYNYLYGDDELREWVARINAMRHTARDVYVFTNNHYRGQGVANALELRFLLDGRRSPCPRQLLAAYPALGTAALPPQQPELFDTAG